MDGTTVSFARDSRSNASAFCLSITLSTAIAANAVSHRHPSAQALTTQPRSPAHPTPALTPRAPRPKRRTAPSPPERAALSHLNSQPEKVAHVTQAPNSIDCGFVGVNTSLRSTLADQCALRLHARAPRSRFRPRPQARKRAAHAPARAKNKKGGAGWLRPPLFCGNVRVVTS